MRKGEHNVRESLAVIVALALLVTTSVYGGAFMHQFPQFAAVVTSIVVELTNDERLAASLSPLKVSTVLTSIAEARARDMATRGYFAHQSPEGFEPWHWYDLAGYKFLYAGENLAIDYTESPDVVRAWMNSPTHRANIVGSQFTYIGVAVATGTYQGRAATIVVQEFGTPVPGLAPAQTKRVGIEERHGNSSVAVAVDAPLVGTSARASTTPTSIVVEPVALSAAPHGPESVLGTNAGAITSVPTYPWWFGLLHTFKSFYAN